MSAKKKDSKSDKKKDFETRSSLPTVSTRNVDVLTVQRTVPEEYLRMVDGYMEKYQQKRRAQMDTALKSLMEKIEQQALHMAEMEEDYVRNGMIMSIYEAVGVSKKISSEPEKFASKEERLAHLMRRLKHGKHNKARSEVHKKLMMEPKTDQQLSDAIDRMLLDEKRIIRCGPRVRSTTDDGGPVQAMARLLVQQVDVVPDVKPLWDKTFPTAYISRMEELVVIPEVHEVRVMRCIQDLERHL